MQNQPCCDPGDDAGIEEDSLRGPNMAQRYQGDVSPLQPDYPGSVRLRRNGYQEEKWFVRSICLSPPLKCKARALFHLAARIFLRSDRKIWTLFFLHMRAHLISLTYFSFIEITSEIQTNNFPRR